MLVTVFSAPDYPQFQAIPESDRFNNKAAVVHLCAPDYDQPEVQQFEAALPRPQVRMSKG